MLCCGVEPGLSTAQVQWSIGWYPAKAISASGLPQYGDGQTEGQHLCIQRKANAHAAPMFCFDYGYVCLYIYTLTGLDMGARAILKVSNLRLA